MCSDCVKSFHAQGGRVHRSTEPRVDINKFISRQRLREDSRLDRSISVKSEGVADRQLPAGGFYSKDNPRIKIEQYDADSGEMELVDVPRAMAHTPLMYEAFMAAAREETAFRSGHTQMFDQHPVKIELHHHPAPPVAAYAPGPVPYAAYPPTSPEELWRQGFAQEATALEVQATVAVAKEQLRHQTTESAMVQEGQALLRQLQASQSDSAKLQEQVRQLEQLAAQRAQQLLQQQQQNASDAAARAAAQEASMAKLVADHQAKMRSSFEASSKSAVRTSNAIRGSAKRLTTSGWPNWPSNVLGWTRWRPRWPR